MSILIRSNYNIYRQWFDRSLDLIWQLPPELRSKADPMKEIAKAELESSAKAIRSLSAAIRDTVAMTDRYTEEDIKSADREFEKDNLPSLSNMRAIFDRGILKILKSSNIKSENDYYKLKSIEDCELPVDIKEKILKMMGAFEISRS